MDGRGNERNSVRGRDRNFVSTSIVELNLESMRKAPKRDHNSFFSFLTRSLHLLEYTEYKEKT